MNALARPAVRIVLRSAQVLTAAWVLWSAYGILGASPAAADNCSVFTDCFGQANSAAETGFGLALLTGLSLILDFVPVVGDVKGVVEAVTGRDALTGEELEPWERALGLIPLVPGTRLLGLADEVVGAGRHVDELGGAGRRVDDAGGLVRSADDLGPAGRADPPTANPRPSPGTTYPVDPRVRGLVDEYGRADTTPARRGRISEEIGEAGGMSYLRNVSGNPDLPMVRPSSDAEVAGLRDAFESGEPWPHAVSFGGSHATNIVYFDGDTLHIIEAKGGSSPYAVRTPTSPHAPGLSQTDPDYPGWSAPRWRSLLSATAATRSARSSGTPTIGAMSATSAFALVRPRPCGRGTW